MADGEFDNLTVNNVLTIGADTNLYRSAANTLKTDDVFKAAQIKVGTAIFGDDQGGAIELGDSSQSDTRPYIDFHYGNSSSEDFNVRLQNYGEKLLSITAISSGGKLNLVNMGLAFEDDTNLYRSAANRLRTDDIFVLGGGATGASPTAQIWFGTGYFDDSGAPSASHIALYGTIYGFGISAGDLDILTDQRVVISSDSNADAIVFDADNYLITLGSDVSLYRSAVNELKTDDLLNIGHNNDWKQISLCPDLTDVVIEKTLKSSSHNWFWLEAYADAGYAASIGVFRGTVSGTPRFLILNGDNYATTPFEFLPREGKLVIFSDTNLYRLSNNVLKTDDDFHIGGALQIGSDVNLYRSEADTLKTDDKFVASQLQAYGFEADVLNGRVFMVDPDGDNDSAKIQDAVDAAETAGGGLVLLNAGTYDIVNTITVGSDLKIVGLGQSTVLSLNADIDYIFETKSGQRNLRNFFGYFAVEGNKDSRSKGTAIHLQSCKHGEVKCCYINNMKTNCIYMSGSEEHPTLGCHISYNYMSECEGDFVTNGAFAQDLLAEHNIIGGEDDAIGTAFVLSWDTHALIHHNHMWKVEKGIHAYFAHFSQFLGNIIDNPRNRAIFVQSSNNVIIAENKIKNPCTTVDEEEGILVEGTSQNPSDDCLIANNMLCIDNSVEEYDGYVERAIQVGNWAPRAFITGNHCYNFPDGTLDIKVTETGTTECRVGMNYGRYRGSLYVKGDTEKLYFEPEGYDDASIYKTDHLYIDSVGAVKSNANIWINKTNPVLKFSVSDTVKTTLEFDGSDTKLATAEGKIILHAISYTKAIHDLHVDDPTNSVPTINLTVNDAHKGAFGYADGDIFLRSDVGSIKLHSASNAVLPYDTNQTLGSSGNYWANLYSTLATIGNSTITNAAIFTNFQDQLKFQISGEDEIYHMCRPDINRIWGVYNKTDTTWKAYLQNSDGSMYVDGTYQTFSPKLSNERSEIIEQLKHEIEKPYVDRDDKGRIVCPYCKKIDCENSEHIKLRAETYAKDIGLVSLASGKLVTLLSEEVDSLKSRLAKIEIMKGAA